MKKKSLVLATISVLSFGLVGCGQGNNAVDSENNSSDATAAETATDSDEENDITFEDLVSYNASREVFANHKNFSATCTIYDEEGSTFNQDLYGWFKSYNCYADKDSCLYMYEYSDSDDSITYEDSYFVGYNGYFRTIFKDGTERYSVNGYFMEDKDIKEYAFSSDKCTPFDAPEEDSPNKEEVKSIEKSDGVIYVTTECNIENSEELSFVPDEYKGAVCQYHYEFNADTKDVLSAKMDILLDEKTINFLSQEYQYDVDSPEDYDLMVDFTETTKEIDPNDSRTITVIYPDDSVDKEYSVTANNSYRVQTQLLPGYSLYSDRDGTQPFAGSNANDDLVIYAIQNK